MPPRRRLYKILRIAGLVIVGGLLLIGIGGSIASHYFKSRILAKLPQLAAKATDSLYKVSVEDFRINIFTGQVTVYGLRLRPDSDAVARKRAEGRLPSLLATVYIPQVRLWGVHWSDALKEKELSCRKAQLDAPQIDIRLTGSTYKPLSKPGESLKDVWVKSATILRPVIRVQGAGEAPFLLTASGGKLLLRDWRYVPHHRDTTRFFYTASLRANLDSLRYSKAGNLYILKAGGLHFDTDSSSLMLRQLSYAPAVSYDSFYKVIGYRRTIYNFHTASATVKDFDWRSFIYRNVWRAEALSLTAPALQLFYSKVPPPNTSPRTGVFPDDFIQSLGHGLYMPNVIISQGSVEYREQDNRTLREGSILFNNMDGLALHITNDTLRKASPSYLLMHGTLFDRSPFAVALRFDTHDTDGHFASVGMLSNLTADMVSRPVEVLALASVKSLQMGHMDMSIHGNKDSAEGDFAIGYDKLRIRIQYFDSLTERVKGKNVLSFMANNVFLNPSNPLPGEAFRRVHPVVYRDEGQPFFSLVWKLMFNGILQTALRDRQMLDRFRDRRKLHLVKKLQKKTARELNAALQR